MRLHARFFSWWCAAALIVACGSASAIAQDLEVPANLQAAIFKKVFGYVKVGTPKISFVYASGNAKTKDELLGQFKAAGLDCDAIEEGGVGRASGNIIYLVPGVSNETAKKVEKKFVITCSKEFITEGLAAMAVINAGGRPSLLGNMTRIGASKIEVDPQLYRILTRVGN